MQIKSFQVREVGPRWRCRWTLSLPPPKDISNVHLYAEQFLLRDSWKASTQQVRESDHMEKGGVPWQLSGSWGNNPGLEEPLSTIVYIFLKCRQWAGAPSRISGWPAGPRYPSWSRSKQKEEGTIAAYKGCLQQEIDPEDTAGFCFAHSLVCTHQGLPCLDRMWN